MAALLGVKALPEPRPQIFLEEPVENHNTIVMAPGGGFVEKCWPIGNYCELARLLAPRRIIVLGGQRECELGKQLAAAGSHVQNHTGQYRLRDTFRVIAGSSLVICNGSMAMHAAAAFRRPCVALLGGWFPSASLHAKQWTYPETMNLGREAGHESIWTPKEVMQAISTSIDTIDRAKAYRVS
jgi:heptosyltransferase-2